MPSDARFRALGVLGREAHLLDPPPIGALGDALRAMGADALVYLCPGHDDICGLALIVEPDGHIDALDLPALTGDWAMASTVQRAVATRDLSPVPDEYEVGRTLADVCRTGWEAAIRPLLDRWRLSRPGGGQPGHARYLNHTDVPHLVLVPGGALATVPWHATHGDGHWAIDEAAFSYIASARLLVEVARRTTPAGPGDREPGHRRSRPGPAGARGRRGRRLFRTHYAAGRYCGRPDGPAVTATGRGTPGGTYSPG